ncbi:hypothetical protein ACFSKU_18300 [Pontibacter silvestris]|uniref:GyrI-like small molecule binding domain-containing protein n=1 Tax=Pontibacter silvestris TaxID=2305183 RepID=A0ABW4X2W5_9BACT|nr:hypothetical protein [Pontibacter silvestris]MCC9138656.1 hypothetical protein [Pontibacter silvestris]
MNSIDLQQKYSSYYIAGESPEVVDIAQVSYVSILGEGSPGTAAFYGKKKAIKDFVSRLQEKYGGTEQAFISQVVEIFYWYDEEQTGFVDIGEFYTTVDLDQLHYRIAIRIPEYIPDKAIREIARSSAENPFSRDVERFTYTAGKCVQLLHAGLLAGELETLPLLQQFATENGFRKSGMHHEIHVVNFEKGQSQAHLRTILRDPVVAIKQTYFFNQI